MKIGAAKLCTSTSDPEVRLAGFGNPRRVFSGMHDDIWVRALVLEEDGVTAAVVTGDALGFEGTRIEEIRERVRETSGLNVDSILFNASHTHSAPNVMRGQSECIGRYQAAYADWFYDQVVRVIALAAADLEEGRLEWGSVACPGIGVNRRRVADGVCVFAPYEAGLRRDDAFVLRAVCGARTKAVLMKHTCHPSTVGCDLGSADWPGVARRIVEERNPGAVALFAQGCCGNIRVRTYRDPGHPDTSLFRGGDFPDIEYFGGLLADAVQTVLDRPMTPVRGTLSARKIAFELPLRDKLPREEYVKEGAGDSLEAYAARWYAAHYDELPRAKTYTMQRIDLGDTLTLIGMEGEAVVEYEYHMDRLLPGRHVVTLGYSNGNPGYICTADMYRTGGYEPVGSTVCYYLHSGWKPECESIILENAKRLR